jgi:hypothetical protein
MMNKNTDDRGIRYPDSPVRAKIAGRRHCTRVERHAEYAPPESWGELMVAESLDPHDILRFTTCGLCGGLLDILN